MEKAILIIAAFIAITVVSVALYAALTKSSMDSRREEKEDGKL